MNNNLETLLKRASWIAPLVTIVLLQPGFSSDSGNLLGLALLSFPYLIIFSLMHFVKQKSMSLLIANAALLAFIILSSAFVFLASVADPQGSIGGFIVFLVQAFVSALFLSVYFVFSAFKRT